MTEKRNRIRCEKNLTHFYHSSLYLTAMKELNSRFAVFTSMCLKNCVEDICNIIGFGQKRWMTGPLNSQICLSMLTQDVYKPFQKLWKSEIISKFFY